MTDPAAAEPPPLRIGELARQAGVTSRMVRQYHTAGLLPEAPRDAAGYRRYGPQDVALLLRIGRLRSQGLSMDEIAATVAAQPAHRT